MLTPSSRALVRLSANRFSSDTSNFEGHFLINSHTNLITSFARLPQHVNIAVQRMVNTSNGGKMVYDKEPLGKQSPIRAHCNLV